MLKEFNKFLYELNWIYMKELDAKNILEYISSFYKSFLENNVETQDSLLRKTAQAILAAADDLLLERSAVKEVWIRNTSENHILHTNRGGEILNNIVNDILYERITNWEVITIIVTCILNGVKCNRSKDLLSFYKNSKDYFSLHISNNIQKSSIHKNKKTPYNFFYLLLTVTITLFTLTEIYYFFKLQYYVKETNIMMKTVRNLHEYK